MKPNSETTEQRCACGEQDMLGGADVEVGGVCHRKNKPCYHLSKQEETKGQDWDWNKWLDNFCHHISDWSYYAANEELEKMKERLFFSQRERLAKEVEGMKRNKQITDDSFCVWCNGHIKNEHHLMTCGSYNQALDDILSLLKTNGHQSDN